MLYTMVNLATHHAFNMRLKLIDLKILPEVVLRFTIICSDIVCVLRIYFFFRILTSLIYNFTLFLGTMS